MFLEKIDLGLIDYKEFLKRQEEIASNPDITGGQKAVVIFAEHPMVFTVGKLPVGRLFREDGSDVELIKVNRGGSITAHFPGQLMFYVIMNLKAIGLGIKEWMQLLEDVVYSSLFDMNIRGIERRNRGLWIGMGKVASFGVGVRHWITRFGAGITYKLDDSVNERVYPCGEDGVFANVKVSRDDLVKALQRNLIIVLEGLCL